MMPGIKVGRANIMDVPYVDDENVLITNKEELLVLDKIFLQSESVLGAIVNRSHKSKILGLAFEVAQSGACPCKGPEGGIKFQVRGGRLGGLGEGTLGSVEV
jgi:hypothetical protein